MQRTVSTLDHYLPKAHYPSLAVTPINLVPACSDCNKAKLDAVPQSAEDVPLHPYYDDLGDDIWLTAVVVQRHPAALKYSIVRPAAWSDTLYARARSHFNSLNLGSLFASEAAEELLNIRHQLKMIHDINQGVGVRDELLRRAESCSEIRKNSWRSAAYNAWSQSDWFCDRGFL